MIKSTSEQPRFKVCIKPDCPHIGQPQSIENFHVDNKLTSGRRNVCKSCKAIQARRLEQEHPGRKLQYNRQWQRSHRDHVNARNRKSTAKHRERILKEQREKYRSDPESHVRKGIAYARRKARQFGLPIAFTSRDWRHALNYFQGRCAVCGRPPGFWHTLAMDHWIPISSPDCPGTMAINIIPLCHGIGGCNNSKHDKPPEQWLIQNFGERKAKKILKRIHDYFDSLE